MRIKYSMLPKLQNLTNREMDFLLYIARYQDLAGNVPGVHNKDVCKHTGMCKQSFYTVMRSLEEKKIIKSVKRSEIDYDILILDNDFSYTGAFQEGYVNLHRQIFHQKQFKTLKSNEKYLLMELLKRTHENSSSFQIRTKKLYEVFTKLLGVTERVIRYYLRSLRKFFSIGIKKGKYYITYLHSVFQTKEKKGVEEQEFEYFVKVQCRRRKIKYTETELGLTAALLKQYRPEVIRQGGDINYLKQILARCIQMSGVRLLNGKYIHKLVRSALLDSANVF